MACYNEEAILKESVRQTFEILEATSWNYEVIFVDDCSQDRTREIIDEILAENPEKNLSKLFHAQNTGRGRTVTDGIHMARGEVVGYIDIDLEVHARYIPSMVIAIHNGADLATANRIYKVQPRLVIRWILSQGYAYLMRFMLGVNIQDTETGYKFFNRQKILPVLQEVKDEHWFWDTEVMVRSFLHGYEIHEIPCLFIRRYDKQSTVNEIQDTLDYLRNLWRFRKEIQGMPEGKASSTVPPNQVPRQRLDTD